MASVYPNANTDDRMKATATKMADNAADLAQKAGQQIDRAMDTAQSAARTVSEQGKEATERMTEVAGNLKGALDKSVREQPMATLAVVAAFGFVLGALWKS